MTQPIDPISALTALVAAHGTQRDAAKVLKISGAMMSDLLKGRRPFSVAMLKKLGLKRVVMKA